MSSGWHYEVGQPRLEATLQVLPPDGADWVEHDDLDPDKQGDSTVPSNRMELHFFSATSAGQRFQVTRRPDVCVTAYPKEATAIVAPGGTVHRFIDYERPAADLPRMRLHDMRHTHASLMLKAGESMEDSA